MSKINDFRRGRNCVFMMHAHLVFFAKWRGNIFTQKVLKHLHAIFEGVCKDFSVTLVEFEGEMDYVQLLIHYPPTVSISKLVNSLKGVSSRMIRKENYPSVQKALYANALWSPSYFAGSCNGPPLELIEEYIQQEQTPRRLRNPSKK